MERVRRGAAESGEVALFFFFFALPLLSLET